MCESAKLQRRLHHHEAAFQSPCFFRGPLNPVLPFPSIHSVPSLSSFLMFMCVPICMKTGICRDHRSILDSFLNYCRPYFLRCCFSLSIDCSGSVRLGDLGTTGTSHLYPPNSGISKWTQLHLAFYVGHEYPDSGPHMYTASTLPTEKSLHHLGVF